MVPVPAGVEDGQTVRVAVGRREVFVTFKVAKSDYFKRHVSLPSFSVRSFHTEILTSYLMFHREVTFIQRHEFRWHKLH